MISTTRRTPLRDLSTDWGTIFVRCTRPDELNFTTNRTTGGGESQLVVNRIAYSCSVYLRRDLDDAQRSRAQRCGESWYVLNESAWYGLQRLPRHSEATEGARRIFTGQILPALGTWAEGEEAAALLAEGDSYWRADCRVAAEETERTLLEAIQRVRDIRAAVAAGGRISADDEKYLRMVRPGFHR